MGSIGKKDLLRALQAEEDALQKIHAQLRIGIQKLEAEEGIFQVMLDREVQRLSTTTAGKTGTRASAQPRPSNASKGQQG